MFLAKCILSSCNRHSHTQCPVSQKDQISSPPSRYCTAKWTKWTYNIQMQFEKKIKGSFVEVMPSTNNVARARSYVIFATSFWFAESFSFSVSVQTTGMDHIAVLADSKNIWVYNRISIRNHTNKQTFPHTKYLVWQLTSHNILDMLKTLVKYNVSWHSDFLNDQDMIIDCYAHVGKISL